MVRKASILVVTAIAAILANAASATAAPSAQVSKPPSSLASVNLFGGAPVAGQKQAPKYAAAVGAPTTSCSPGFHKDDDNECVANQGTTGGYEPGVLVMGGVFLVGLTAVLASSNDKDNSHHCSGAVSNC